MDTLINSLRWFLFSQLAFTLPWIIPFKDELSFISGIELSIALDYGFGVLGFIFLIIALLKLKAKPSQATQMHNNTLANT